MDIRHVDSDTLLERFMRHCTERATIDATMYRKPSDDAVRDRFERLSHLIEQDKAEILRRMERPTI